MLICVFCEADREDSQQLFLECTFLFQIWCEVYRWWAIYLVQHSKVPHHFMQHGFLWRDKRMHRVCYLIQYAICWSLSFHRNCIIFHGEVVDAHVYLWQIQTLSWSWLLYRSWDVGLFLCRLVFATICCFRLIAFFVFFLLCFLCFHANVFFWGVIFRGTFY